MAKKKSKSDIIATYVSRFPDATWKTAQSSLESKGIKPGYFASERSKLKAAGLVGENALETEEGADLDTTQAVASGPKKRGPKKRGPKPGGKRETAGASSDLTAAAQFARSAGGLEKARALLEQLAKVQV